jgi:hypothetical protein
MARVLWRWIPILALLACPVIASAQEATVTGTITDSTGAVLPGVTVVAVHQATGNHFLGVTDDRGIYRRPVEQLCLRPIG